MSAANNEKATGQGGFINTANQSSVHSNPSYPVRGTQPARLLALLMQRSKVNPLLAWRTLGIYRLSDTVYQLRGLGWPVATRRLDVANRFNEPCRVAEYCLDTEAIIAAGQMGEEFALRELESMASVRRAA